MVRKKCDRDVFALHKTKKQVVRSLVLKESLRLNRKLGRCDSSSSCEEFYFFNSSSFTEHEKNPENAQLTNASCPPLILVNVPIWTLQEDWEFSSSLNTEAEVYLDWALDHTLGVWFGIRAAHLMVFNKTEQPL